MPLSHMTRETLVTRGEVLCPVIELERCVSADGGATTYATTLFDDVDGVPVIVQRSCSHQA